MTTTASTWASADRITGPRADPARTDGGSRPHPDGPTRTLPAGDIEPDWSTCPSRLPWMPYHDLAALLADGHEPGDVGALVADRLAEVGGRRSNSLGQMAALREWVSAAHAEVMAEVYRRARVIAAAREREAAA